MPTLPTGFIAASPSFFRSALRIYDLSLGQMLWSRRTVFMALIVGGPVAVAVLLLTASSIVTLVGMRTRQSASLRA